MIFLNYNTNNKLSDRSSPIYGGGPIRQNLKKYFFFLDNKKKAIEIFVKTPKKIIPQ